MSSAETVHLDFCKNKESRPVVIKFDFGGWFWGRLGTARPRSAWPGPDRLGSALALTPPGAKKVPKWLPAGRCQKVYNSL